MRLPDGTVRKTQQTYNTPGHIHELTFSTHDQLPLLAADRTRIWFLESLARARRIHDLLVIAFVIMRDHAHVLIFPKLEGYSVAEIRKSIKQPVARKSINWLREHRPDYLPRLQVARPNGRVEHRFWRQGGGYDRNITSDRALRNSIRYLHRNPVKAGMVSLPEDWEWSSARAYLGQPHPHCPIDFL